MINVKVTVTCTSQEPVEYAVRPVSQVAFEREHGCSIVRLAEEQRLSDVYWLAWHAATRGAQPFDAWLEQVEDIAVNFGGASNPTQETPSLS